MDSKSNTATLLSSSKSRNYNFRSGGGNTTRYIVGSIGRACRAHTRKNSQHHQHLSNHSNSTTSVGQQRHQNVAIATQVINPSAIGGSLKNRRFVEHFGPREDDQISFLSRRRRTVFGKACWYIASIAITLMMITGLILAVGYLQSEKQRISTRPVKLAQGQSYESLIIGTTTTRKPPIFPTPAVHPPKDSAEEEADDMDEIGVEDYLDELGLQSLEKDIMFPHTKVSGSADVSSFPASPDSHSQKDDDESNAINSSENELLQETDDNEISSRKNEKPRENSDDTDIGKSASTPSSDIKDSLEKSHEEVKVYNGFGGLSFEFPIYRANNKGSSSNNHETQKSFSSSNTANTANDHNNDYETKEPQKNSSSNFTSLLDSDENETEYEHEEEALSNTDNDDDGDEKNYANASDSEQTNNKKDLSFQQNETMTIEKQIEQSSDETSNADPTDIITNTKQQLTNSNDDDNNGNHNDTHDFKTTSSTKLQTDLFDNNEELADFETSASEEFLENERYPSNRNQKLQNHNEHRLPPPPNHFNKQHESSHSFRSHQSNRNNRNRNNNFNENRNRDDSSNTKGLPSSIEIIDSLGDDDELEKIPNSSSRPPPPPPNRNDPRKLSLRPPSHYDRNKSKLNPPKISPSKDLDKVLLLDDPPKESIPSTTTTTSAPPQTDPAPILEYKVDFSKFLSSTTATTEAPPSTDPESFNDLNKLIAQLPPGAANPYPSFKFDFAPTTSVNTGAQTSDNTGANFHVPSATTDFNLNLAQLQPYSSGQTLSNTIPGSSGDSSSSGGVGGDGSFDAFTNPANQFSKRTFNNFDSSASGSSSISNKANTNSNPFAYLLGSQSSTTGVFGSPSSTGATLNLFQPQTSFNFDTSASNPQGSFNIPSGIVPVDLSASHISVNGGSSSSSDLPYPNLDTTGSYSQQPSKFSFNSYDISNTGSNHNFGYGSGANNDVPILTTRNGLVPNYNTITQGINLLKLLSPIPQNQNGYDDQQSFGSSNIPTYSYSPQVDFSKSDSVFPSFTSGSPASGSSTGAGGSSGSGHAFLDFWKWKNSAAGQQDFTLQSSPSEIISTKVIAPSSSSGFDPRSSFRSIDTSDDLSSSGSSFSKVIVSKAQNDLKNAKLLSSKIPSPTSEPTLLSLTSNAQRPNSQPRSISISILPKPVSSFIDALTKRPANKRKPQGSSSSSADAGGGDPQESLQPKSRKRLSPQNYEDADETAPSSSTPIMSDDITTTATTKRHPELRLKSGFFT